MKIDEINTGNFRARCLLTIIAILNIVVTFFQGGTSGMLVQIILGILLVCGNDIVRILFIVGSILGMFFGIFIRISDTVSIFKIDVYFVLFILCCIFTIYLLMYNKDILEYIKIKKEAKIKKREKIKEAKLTQNKSKRIRTLIIIVVLCISAFFYLTTPVNYINISENIENYDLGEGIVFLELNYKGSIDADVDDYWTMDKFNNGLPITAWQNYTLTDELIESFEKSNMNFPHVDSNDSLLVISYGRKLENLYYYKESAYINSDFFPAYIGEPVFSKEYYDNTMFIYTLPGEFLNLAPYEATDDNVRFNKDGDVPYEVRPYTKRTASDVTTFMRSESRLDIILKKFKN